MANTPHSRRGWRMNVELAFERWGRWVYRRRWWALLLSIVVTAWLASFLPQLTIDNSTETLLLPSDPAVQIYNEMRDQFGRDDVVLLAVVGSDPFSESFIDQLEELHRAIEEEVPHIVDVDSLLNARVTRGHEDGLVVDELFSPWPETDEARARIRDFAESNPIYRDFLLSADGRMTAIAITPATYSQQVHSGDDLSGFDDAESGDVAGEPVFLTAAEADAIVETILSLIDRFDRPDFRLHLAGALPMTHRINLGMTRDITLMMPIATVMMAIVLGILFRRIGGVVLPIAIVALSMIGTVGVMIIAGIPGSVAVQILPVFLLTVGVCDAVHVLALVYRFRMQGEDEESAVARAVGHSGLAILMTSVTTAAGLGSFISAEMAAVVDLGILAPIGVAFAFVYTLVLLPALLGIFPLPVARRGSDSRNVFPLEGFLVAVGTFAARHPYRVLFPASILVVVGFLGALQVSFSHNGLGWFEEEDRIRVDFQAVDQRMAGSVSVDLLVDSRRAGGLYDPELLNAVDQFLREAKGLPIDPLYIGKAMSILDIVKETHLALNEGREEMRKIPSSRDLIAQELLLFENSGSDDTEDFVDAEYRTAHITMRVPFADAFHYPRLIDDLRNLGNRRLAQFADVEVTGLMTLLAQILSAVVDSMMRSYIFALCVITPLMMILVGSLRLGLVTMIPNLLPVLAVLATAGWLGIAFDSTTMLVGAMVIGIAVDDTIHFMHKFQRYLEEIGDVEGAIRETLRTTGSALLFTTLVLTTGFTVFWAAEMGNFKVFGSLAALATVVALAADILIAPALLTLVESHRARQAVVSEAVGS